MCYSILTISYLQFDSRKLYWFIVSPVLTGYVEKAKSHYDYSEWYYYIFNHDILLDILFIFTFQTWLARYKCRKVGFESSQMLQHFGDGWKRSNKFTGTSTLISSLKLHRQMQFPGANVNSFVCSQLRHSSNKLVASPCHRRSFDRCVKRERKWFMTRA